MANDDLEKLRKKVEKDPHSKLSLPLAEEYKKMGMLDDAINVLLKALEIRPDYTSARVALGKIYLDRDMLPEARDEFEKVVILTPDNYLAHKKLADIYYQQGETDKAFEEYQAVLKIHPNDEEARALMSSLSPAKEGSDTAQSRPKPSEGLAADSGDLTDRTEPDPAENYPDDTEKIPGYEIHDDVNGADLGIEFPEKLTPVTEGSENEELEHFRKIMEAEQEEPPVSGTVQEQPEEGILSDEPVSASEESPEQVKEAVQTPHDKPKSDKIVVSMRTETMADIFITQDQYDKAMNIYNEILASEPGNERIIQRREELKTFLKLKEEKYKGDQ